MICDICAHLTCFTHKLKRSISPKFELFILAKLITYESSYWRLFQIREKFEDIKVVIINRKLKDRQHLDNKKKDKRTNNDLQTIYRKIKIDQREPHLKPGCSVRVINSCSTCGICHLTFVTNPVTSHEWKNDRVVISKNGA